MIINIIMQRKVLITGITGYLGTHVAKLCLEQGYSVRGAVLNLQDKAKLSYIEELQQKTGKKIELVEVDLAKYDSWDYAVKGCQSVLHLAAPLPSRDTNNDRIESAMLNGMQSILDHSKKHNVKNVIATGSALNTGIYSPTEYKKVYTEKDWANADNFPDGYTRGKVRTEKYAWNYSKTITARFGLTFINPAVMYGPILSKLSSGSIGQIANMMTGRPAYFHLCLPIVDVRDVALAHVKAVMNDNIADGQRYLCSGGSLWLDEIPGILDGHFGKYGYKCKRMPRGDWVIRLAALFNKDAKKLLLNEALDFEVSSAKIKSELGINFRNPKQTIIDTVSSLIEKGIIPNRINQSSEAAK